MKKINLLLFMLASTFVFSQYCDSTPTSNDANGIGDVVLGSTTYTSSGDVTTEDYTAGTIVDFQAGNSANVQITFETGYSYDTHIWIDFEDDDSFAEDGNLVFSGNSVGTNPTTFDASFSLPSGASLGNHRMRIGTADSGQASPDPCYSGSYGVTLDFVVNITTPPSCSIPLALAISNITMTSADLAWTAGGSETMWEVVYAATPYTQPSNSMADASAEPGYTHVTATSLSLSSLTAGTTYDVYYRGHCGGTEYSDWVTASFSTPAQGATCETAIPVANLPYSTSDDTANYGDNYSGTPGASGCGTTSNYLNGDDVVYAYTATADGSINFALSSIGSNYSGMFVYTDCADIGTACVAGVGNGWSTDDYAYDVDVTNGTTYYVVISTYASPQSTTYTLDITQNTCTSATADFAVVSDCDVSGGFNIEVAISDMGSATGLTVSDDQGNDSQAATATGTLTFGPYDNGTVVVISMVDDSDATCAITAALTQENCPPANNVCASAIALSTGATFDSNPTVGTFVGATDSGIGAPSCSSYGAGLEVWFSIEVPADGIITIETNNASGSSVTDTGMEVYSGACGALVSVECDDDDSADGYFSMVEISGRTAGEILYVRVFEYGGNTEGEFQVSAYNATLNIEENAIEGFSMYPNPVKDQLQLQAQDAISKVTVYDLLGQKVLTVQPNVLSTAIDMTALKTGMYVLKVQVADKISTYRVLKQ